MQKNNFYYQPGFTLIEILFVVVIISLLSLVAYPTYQNTLLKTRRAEAKSALHSVMLQQERFYTQHNTYSTFTSGSENLPFKPWSGDSAASSYYEISASLCPEKQLTQCVLLTATPGTANVKSHEDPICGNLMLDSASNKSYSKSTESNAACW